MINEEQPLLSNLSDSSISDQLKQMQDFMLNRLMKEFIEKITLNLLFLFYSLFKMIIIGGLLLTEEAYCFNIELWLLLIVSLDIINTIYFLSSIIAHSVIYKRKTHNVLNKAALFHYLNNNNHYVSSTNFLLHSHVQQHQQQQQDMLSSSKYKSAYHKGFNFLDYYLVVYQCNIFCERVFQILMLMRHVSQYSYYLLYVYGVGLYIYLQEDCMHVADNLLDAMFVCLFISTLYLVFPLVLFFLFIIMIGVNLMFNLGKIVYHRDLYYHHHHQGQNSSWTNDNQQPQGPPPLTKNDILIIPEISYDQSNNEFSNEVFCIICYLDFENGQKLKVLPCNPKHNFHGECIGEWLLREARCPICRIEITQKELQQKSSNLVL